MNRLRAQLILAFTLVVLVAVGAIALLINQTADTAFRRYVTLSDVAASGGGVQALAAYYQQQGSWQGVGTLLGEGVAISSPPPGRDWAGGDPRAPRRPMWLDVLLADADGQIVFDSTGKAEGRQLNARERSSALVISEEETERVLGYLLLAFPSGLDRLGRLEQQFLDNIRRILVVGGVVAVALGLVLGVLLSQSLTAPLQRLAAAARAVAAGDLGQRVKVEGSAEMAEVAQAFNEMTTALGESERQRRNMVADTAHELRTPLTVLQGNLRAILDGVYPLDQTEISRLYDETRLLGRLVDDLRELALADAGQLRLNLRPTDVSQIIRSTMGSLAPAAEAQEVDLTTEVPDDLPQIRVDADRVAQVLRNLLVNALRHTPAGGSVRVTATEAGEAVELAVIDTGEGIAPEDLPHIFERLWQADRARSRDDRGTGGSGLGLSVAQSLVEAQGGRIWAESSPGQGSTFRFTLPVAPASP